MPIYVGFLLYCFIEEMVRVWVIWDDFFAFVFVRFRYWIIDLFAFLFFFILYFTYLLLFSCFQVTFMIFIIPLQSKPSQTLITIPLNKNT